MGAVFMPKAACSEEWNQIAAEIDFNKTVHPSLWTKKQAKKMSPRGKVISMPELLQ